MDKKSPRNHSSSGELSFATNGLSCIGSEVWNFFRVGLSRLSDSEYVVTEGFQAHLSAYSLNY